MIKDLLPGFRSLRSSLIAGAMILITAYLLSKNIHAEIEIPEPVNEILSLNELTKVTLIALVAIMVGSLYVTALEGVVDWMHRRYVGEVPSSNTLFSPVSRFKQMIAPFSPSAYARITSEVKRFYVLHGKHEGYCKKTLQNVDEAEFIVKNLIEILWLEGKIVGTSLQDAYNQYRSEGESRLAIAILLPVTIYSVCYAFCLAATSTVVILIVVVFISLKLVDYGLYYYRRANSFLAHHIADGKLLTSTMEDFARNCEGE